MIRVATAAGIILLIVTASNVAHLLAARAESQRKTFAVRWALGAGRWSLFSWRAQSALLLTLLSGLAATALSSGVFKAVAGTLPRELRFLGGIEASSGTFLFATCVCLLILVCFGSLPGLFRARRLLIRDLMEDQRFGRHSSLGRAFSQIHIVTMVAASFVLAVASYLVVATVFSLGRADLGFQAKGLYSVTVNLPEWKYREEVPRTAFFEMLAERLFSLLDVSSISIASGAPPEPGILASEMEFGDEARGGPAPTVIGRSLIGQDYFRTLGQRVAAGRNFGDDDFRQETGVVIISRATSQLLGSDPEAALGQQIRFGEELREVIGVVADIRTPGILATLDRHHVYFPLTNYRRSMTILVRTRINPGTTLRTVIRDLDPDVIAETVAMETRVADSIEGIRFLKILLSLMASLAIGLAVIGVYGMLSNFAIQQRGQIALRMAVGADEKAVRLWLLWKGLSKGLVGLAMGLLASYPFCRLLTDQLFEVEPDSMAARIVAAIAILSATTAATWLPAVRASQVAPFDVLKEL